MSGSFLALAGVACGSSSNSNLFGGGGTTSGTGGTGAHGGNGTGGSSTGGSSTGGSGTGGSGTGGSSAGGSGMGGSSAGGSGMGGSSAGGSGFGGSGAGGTSGSGGSGFGGSGFGGSGGVTNQTVACGSSSCNVGTDYCCDFTNKEPACNQIGGTPCYPSTDLYCDGPEDCPSGQVCCGQLVQVQGQQGQTQVEYNQVKCATSCPYNQTFPHGVVFCHDSSQCDGGQSCNQSQVLPAYKVCG